MVGRVRTWSAIRGAGSCRMGRRFEDEIPNARNHFKCWRVEAVASNA